MLKNSSSSAPSVGQQIKLVAQGALVPVNLLQQKISFRQDAPCRVCPERTTDEALRLAAKSRKLHYTSPL